MNYIKAIIESFKADPDISGYIADRVAFLWQDLDTERPFITFHEWSRENTMRGWWYGGNAMDSFPLSFSIVVDQKDTYKWREIRELLKEKLNGYNGVLYKDPTNNKVVREGNIWFLGDEGVQYFDWAGLVLWETTYLFKTQRRFFVGSGKDIVGNDIW